MRSFILWRNFLINICQLVGFSNLHRDLDLLLLGFDGSLVLFGSLEWGREVKVLVVLGGGLGLTSGSWHDSILL